MTPQVRLRRFLTNADDCNVTVRSTTKLQLIGVGLIALYLATFVTRNVSLQWDLKAYLLAARAAMAGLDPYRPEDLAILAGGRVVFPYLYPPIALAPFFALAALPAAIASLLWICAKVLILAGLVFVWARCFVPRAGPLAIVLIAVFGWNAAALWDLRSGNVALIECALLWAGFTCFVAGRRSAFAVLVVAASCFKLTPSAYLLLLLVPIDGQTRRPGHLIAALVALGALVWVPLAIGPASRWQGFLGHLPEATTMGNANPSGLALASALSESLGATGPAATGLATGIWAAYLMTLLALSVPFLRHAWHARDARCWVMAAVVLDLLIAPRPMAYGFVRLGPAPLFFATELLDRPAGSLLVALMFSAQGLARCANQQLPYGWFVYLPFLLTLAVWLLVIRATPRPAARHAVA